MIVILFSILTLGTFLGCSSKFVIKSDPLQADISFIDLRNGTKKAMGKTPFEMTSAELRTAFGDSFESGEFVTLELSSKGYLTEKFSLPVSKFGTLVTELDVKLKAGNDEGELRLARETLDAIFLAQRLALAKEYERAQIEIDRVLKEFPEFPRALSMRASIYFMQKNYSESIKWYEKALKADPKLEDAIKMTARIRELQGRSAASVGGGKGSKP